MSKNIRKKDPFLGIYDSREEVYFSWYLDELKEAGLLVWRYLQKPEDTIQVIPASKIQAMEQLKTKNKIVDRAFLRSLEYTPDFRIEWTSQPINCIFIKHWDLLPIPMEQLDNPFFAQSEPMRATSIIDVKANDKRSANSGASNRVFSVMQKILFNLHRIHVQKIVIEKLFAETFTPRRYMLTDGKTRTRKVEFKIKTLNEYVTSRTRTLGPLHETS